MSDTLTLLFAGLWILTLLLWAVDIVTVPADPKAHIGETPDTDPRGQ